MVRKRERNTSTVAAIEQRGPLALVQGIAFDLEGTLINLEPLHHLAHLQAAADVGIKLSRPQAIKKLPHFVGGPDEQVAAEIASLAETKPEAQRILASKRMYFEQLLHQNGLISPRRGAIEFLEWVENLGLGMAIGTVTERALAMHLLEQSGLLRVLKEEAVVAREDVRALKPSPDVYTETARRLGISPSNQLVFEDSVTGLTCAHAAGSRSVAMPTIPFKYFAQSLRQAGAEAVFEAWDVPDLRRFVREVVDPSYLSWDTRLAQGDKSSQKLELTLPARA
jgi:beta-phosphoglucomutase